MSLLKEIGGYLIDIHSQHETLTLNDSGFQLSVVDAFAKNVSLADEYREEFLHYRDLKKQLEELITKDALAKKEQDFLQFQFTELEEAKLESLDTIELEKELELLNNAENIKACIAKAENALDGGDVNLLRSLAAIRASLAPFLKLNKELENLHERLSASYVELKDVASGLVAIQDSIHHDASRIETITGLLDGVYRLQQKHRVNTVDDLLLLKAGLEKQLEDISSLDGLIGKLKEDISQKEKNLHARAKKISDRRKEAAPKIEKEISGRLRSLGMHDGKLEVKIETDNILNSSGTDSIVFLFTANKGSDAKELNKVASGGELSRLMLSIKSLIAKLTQLPSIIFDEIDSGVSGEVADKVGSIMENMGDAMQVIAITHLPQIASKGNTHFFVHKEVKDGKTYTRIRILNRLERVQEIAKMLSSDEPTAAAMKNAKELLKS